MRGFFTVVLVSLFALNTGCSAFRVSIKDKDPEKASHLSARFDQKDLLSWGKLLADDIVKSPFMVRAKDKPIAVSMGIQNRTSTHLDSQALADTIETELLNSGRMRFISSAQRDTLMKEQGFQMKNTPRGKRVKIGEMLGAKYILTGSLAEISHKSGREARLSKKQDVYYQLTVQVTDVQSGEIVLSKQRDRLRRESKPLIGW